MRVFRSVPKLELGNEDEVGLSGIPLSVPKLELGNEDEVDQASFPAFSFRFTPR